MKKKKKVKEAVYNEVPVEKKENKVEINIEPTIKKEVSTVPKISLDEEVKEDRFFDDFFED